MHLISAEADRDRATLALNELRIDDTDDAAGLGLCLHEVLERAAENYSNSVALVCGNARISFGELNSFANRFARVLIQRGVGNGDLVGVALDRSVELVAALLAVLKTGAAYVPIEPALPAERISQMVDDARPKLLIAGASTLIKPFVSHGRLCCLSVDEVLEMMDQDTSSSDNNVGVTVRSDDLAYVMYTSGSTGRPKGVEIRHRSVTNLLLSMQREPGCGETDRLLAITTVSFDMAVFELFLPLLCGATTVIAQKHQVKDTAALVGLMEHHRITMMQGTPAIWQMLLDSGWCGQHRLGKIFCGGEALPRTLANRLLACGDEVWNMYGPTEATVYASIWRVCQDQDVVIGSPIANSHLYVLDENLSPVPLGSPGELCIGGAGVARGYRNNSKLSRSQFLDNPFHPGLMYRTGDLARFLAPGRLSVMGRMDGQVKIRGHRIEPGDVEAAITEHEDMSGAVVVCRDDRLVAYCLRKATGKAFRNGAQGDAASLGRVLRPWLAKRLPDYMVPAFFVEIEAFPMTVNGKIDRKALPDPVAAIPSQTHTTAVTPATTGLESRILAIWSKILGHDRIGVRDNFFEIGGDSARVVRVQQELERLLGRPVPVPKLFEHYTISALAAHLTSLPNISGPDLRTDTNQHPVRDDTGCQDIAIVSMACRLPGGITTPEDFWELLECGGDAITNVPKDRWDADALYDARPDAKGRSYCRRGGFLASIDSFDADFFGISPREARSLDPSQYLMLETCWEGFERAGYTLEELRGSQTGVFIGTSNILAHLALDPAAIRDPADLDGYAVTGSAGGTMSGRISYQLGLQGPTMTIDTACSSSLVATHLACNALRQGECDVAVSGGVSLLLNPGLHVEFSRLQGMSPDGRCRSFSADTQGTGWSEGSVAVILKRLSDAQRDGDPIQAVIRGAAVNHDGRSASLTTPSGAAQRRLIHTALAAAGLQPNDMDYVEAHGTGTKLGDPIEAAALAEVFGPSRITHPEPLLIGSVKSNIGHTQAAAGLVGLLKVTLAMQHSMLPQTLHVTKPTQAVDWQRANMTPVLNKQPWPSRENRLRRAGVSAFGIGGTNAHVIVQEPPRRQAADADNVKTAARLPRSLPFLLSGDNDAALRMQAEKLRRHISSNSSSNSSSSTTGISQDGLVDVAYSLATTRSHLRKRLVLIAQDKTELLEKLDSDIQPDSFALPNGTTGASSNTAAEPPKLAMLFTGQGSQWPGMGKDLCEVYPSFGKMIREIAAEFDAELEIPLLDVMWADPGSKAAALLSHTDFAQPALFALEVSLWRLWQDWGVTPDFVLGHSLGELVAAHVAGVLDLPDACRLVAARGRLMQAQSGDYSMVSLEASPAEVATALEQLGQRAKVDVALYNTPSQTVISGDMRAVGIIAGHFAEQGRKTKTVVAGHAFHSRHMDGMLADFRAVVDTVRFHPPQLSIISNLDGRPAKANQLQQADYWLKQAREPVRFSDSIQALAHDHGVNIFLELGPHPVLCGMGAECLADNYNKDKPVAWTPSLIRHQDSALTLQRSVAHLHTRHIPINWQAFFKPFGCRRVQLPTYAFQRKRFVRPGLGTQPRVASASTNGINGTATSIISATTHTAPGGDEGHFQFEVMWHPVRTDNVRSSGTWALLVPVGTSSAWATSVTAALAQAGVQLVQAEHLQEAETLDGLICLWDWDPNDTDVISQARELMPKALTQLQTAARTRFLPPLVWVTHHAVGTGVESDDQTMRLGAEPLLWGLMRTARSEHPELRLRLVDLDQETTSACIPSALLMLHEEPECAVRHGRVFVPRMERVSSIPKPLLVKHRLVRPDGAVLVTGGLGHLGACVARWLVSDHQVRDLVLTSRHGMDAPGADALVTELSRSGARVTVTSGNIADPTNVTEILATFSNDRPLRGIVHAAGVVDSGVLSAMTQERCEAAIAPKVYGAWLLHQLTRHMDLDLFMMFSSISGVMGMLGLANYAAANTFLDALAHQRRAQGLAATSVAYGTWAGDGGMASRLSSNTRSHLAHFGLDPLPPDEALELLKQAVVSTRALTVAAALDMERLRGFFEDHGGSIPPLLGSLLSWDATVTEAPPSLSRRRDLRASLMEAEPGQHAGIMLNTVRQVVAKALGFTHPLDVDVDRPLKDIGIDSLTAVQVRNHLTTLTGLTLSVNIAFLYPNLRALSESLLFRLQQDMDKSPTTIASTTASSTSVQLNSEAVRRGCLDNSFKFDNYLTRDSSRHPPRRPESVFLTGATGFVGAFILYELLKKNIPTYCLVRAGSVDEARQRVMSTLQDYDLWEPNFASLIKPTVGDMAQPLLGLTEQIFNDLADRVDAICHSGALVHWMRPLHDYVGPNIISTHEILRLASRGRAKVVHLVSTISTLPKHMGLDLREGDLEYGYGTSKYIAERLVAAARWRGARAYVYRLPYVTASNSTGHFRHDRGDFLHNLIVGGLEMGAFPSVDADMAAVLPVDYLAKTILAVMTGTHDPSDRHEKGCDFDFLNPRAPTCTDFFKLVGAASGGKQKEIIAFSAWKRRALDYAALHPASSFARITAVLDNYTDENAAAMFKGLPPGDHIFGGDDHPAPLIGEQFINAYLDRINNS
ncbi:Nonribosomal peptide synthetase 7 [Madurella fahalii]|uniref:Nonribosomal peptide synthetase 7 n=1 Tax=Madurella fahalii TaxID=1157608 RepID=A0ABQ0GJJ5_9PEZI